jgi:glycyl-tRNA synthetase beta chain
MSQDFLLEIGVEEIPPKVVPDLGNQLATLAKEFFAEERLELGEVRAFYGPRRLSVVVKNLSSQQPDMEREVKGPAKKAAFDTNGNPTKAAEGFAKSKGLAVTDLTIKKTDEGEYLYARELIRGKPTPELLVEILPALIKKLLLPETMRWDQSGLRFIRPIRWLLALYGEQPVHFPYGRLTSGAETQGNRFFGQRTISVKNIADYFAKLETNGVICDQAQRKQIILNALQQQAALLMAQYTAPASLIDEIANQIEHPTPVVGKFPQEYLSLPKEILASTLIEHQKFIPFVAGEKALSYFVGFRDGPTDAEGVIRAGYERIVKARLFDARFFFEQDRKRKLSDFAKDLRSVVYQEKLGTIWDKVERIRHFSIEIAKRAGFDHLPEIDKTAFLCKADLVTAMVGEFPDLEGIVGGIYAGLDRESPLVAEGIREHYLPKVADDALPHSTIATAVSVADKLDTVVGSLLIGDAPTGSRDPFGLRRRANGVIKLALEKELNLDFFQLTRDLGELYSFLGKHKGFGPTEAFFTERLYQVLLQEYDVSYDILNAVLATPDGNFGRVLRKARSLETIRSQEEFMALVVGFSRARNITQGHTSLKEFDSQLFQDEPERELWRAYLKAEGQITKLLPKEDYRGIIEQLLKLKAPIDAYFEAVLVMSQDREIRNNRLGFLNKLVALFLALGDLSQIVVEGAATETRAPQKEANPQNAQTKK